MVDAEKTSIRKLTKRALQKIRSSYQLIAKPRRPNTEEEDQEEGRKRNAEIFQQLKDGSVFPTIIPRVDAYHYQQVGRKSYSRSYHWPRGRWENQPSEVDDWSKHTGWTRDEEW